MRRQNTCVQECLHCHPWLWLYVSVPCSQTHHHCCQLLASGQQILLGVFCGPPSRSESDATQRLHCIRACCTPSFRPMPALCRISDCIFDNSLSCSRSRSNARSHRAHVAPSVARPKSLLSSADANGSYQFAGSSLMSKPHEPFVHISHGGFSERRERGTSPLQAALEIVRDKGGGHQHDV